MLWQLLCTDIIVEEMTNNFPDIENRRASAATQLQWMVGKNGRVDSKRAQLLVAALLLFATGISFGIYDQG